MKSTRILLGLFALLTLVAGTAFATDAVPGTACEAPAVATPSEAPQAPVQELFVPEAQQTAPPIIPGCQGQPLDDCFCPTYYEPVCGCNGQTYSNSCVAGCDGVRSYTPGACS